MACRGNRWCLQNFYGRRLECLVGGGFGGLVLRLRLCSTHSVFVEFLCFFGLTYRVDEVCLIRKENPNNSDLHKVFLGPDTHPEVSSVVQGQCEGLGSAGSSGCLFLFPLPSSARGFLPSWYLVGRWCSSHHICISGR